MYNCLDTLGTFYGVDSNWFHIGDKDFATHIFRTELLTQGNPLSKVIDIIRNKLDIGCSIFPMAEDYIPTFVETELGRFHFEEYLIKYQAIPAIKKVKYGGNSNSIVPDRVLNLFEEAEKIIIAPSNPLLSIQPILSIPFYTESLKKHKEKVIAISPIVNGRAIKGPVIANMKDLNFNPTSLGVAEYYKGMISTFIFDEQEVNTDIDKILEPFSAFGITAYPFDTIMTSLEKKTNLAKFIIDLKLR
jgi:LPPG:FO 2-phospho-L-lactate transferase